MNSSNVEIRKTATRYYAWFLGMSIIPVGALLCGAYLYDGSLAPRFVPSRISHSDYLSTLILLSLITALAAVCSTLFYIVLGVPQDVKVTDAGIYYHGLKRCWEDIEDIELTRSHLYMIWKDGTRARISLIRPLTYDSSFCSSRRPLKSKKRLISWSPLIELLEERVVLLQVKAILKDINRGKVKIFNSMTNEEPGIWLSLIFPACFFFLLGCVTLLLFNSVEYLVPPLTLVVLMIPSYAQRGFVWIDAEGVGLFRILSGFRYVQFGEDVELQMTPTEISLRVKKHPRRSLTLDQTYFQFPRWLTLRCLLKLRGSRWRGSTLEKGGMGVKSL